jgi:hypothetical protein
MAPERMLTEQAKAAALLARIARGELLGLLGREQAERGYLLYRESRIQRFSWGGDELEGVFAGAPGTVTVVERTTEPRLDCRCDACGTPTSPCAHAVAVLLQWLDVRPTMLRLGPGAIWRSRSRHPFIAPSRSATDRIDLGHLTGVDPRSPRAAALPHRSGAATARCRPRGRGQDPPVRRGAGVLLRPWSSQRPAAAALLPCL